MKYHHYPLIVWSLFKKFENDCKNKVQIKDVGGSNAYIDLAYYSLMQWQFWQFTSKWLSRARAQDKNKQNYCCFLIFLFLFNDAIQRKFITWLVNSALNCTWKPILHSSLRDSCDIGFRAQFNAEFPRQLMNFPVVSSYVRRPIAHHIYGRLNHFLKVLLRRRLMFFKQDFFMLRT